MPLVSVVIPTYNRANEIKKALDSLVLQSFKDFDVIVGDDGSTDNTSEIIDNYKSSLNVRYSWMKNFGGPAKARNFGIDNSDSRFIAFLDSDDWWHHDKLKYSYEALENGFDLVYHDLYLWKSNSKLFVRKAKSIQVKTPVFDDLYSSGNHIPNSSIVVRRSILKLAGRICEDRECIFWEDYDFLLRIAKVTDRFYKIPLTLGYYSLDTDLSSSPEKNIANLESFVKKYVKSSDLITPWWVNYRKALSFIQLKQFQFALNELNAIRKSPVVRSIQIFLLKLSLFHRILLSKF